MTKIKNIYKAWMSTVVCLILMAVLLVMVWFGKLDSVSLVALFPLIFGFFRDPFNEAKKTDSEG